jgi:hypothetical protein
MMKGRLRSARIRRLRRIGRCSRVKRAEARSDFVERGGRPKLRAGRRQWDVKGGDGKTHRIRSASVSGRRGRDASLVSSASTAALHSERPKLSGGRSTGVFVLILETQRQSCNGVTTREPSWRAAEAWDIRIPRSMRGVGRAVLRESMGPGFHGKGGAFDWPWMPAVSDKYECYTGANEVSS